MTLLLLLCRVRMYQYVRKYKDHIDNNINTQKRPYISGQSASIADVFFAIFFVKNGICVVCGVWCRNRF